MMSKHPPTFAFFVSPHGYGHAARASALMRALNEQVGAEFELFTTVPRWFFEESVGGVYRYNEVRCDVGFEQASALRIDLDRTVASLERMLPFDPTRVSALAGQVQAAGCRAVLCDISPMGLAVAQQAQLPSVLVENFSWQWLYASLFDRAPGLRRFSTELERWWRTADHHFQTEPLCERLPDAHLVAPISRTALKDPGAVRRELEIDPDQSLVVLTMGGYGQGMPFLERLKEDADVAWVVTGAHETARDGNLRLFSNQTPIFMPDLLRAADGLVAKLGYGIVAEAWREGIPFMYVSRQDVREMPPLEAFVSEHLPGFEIPTGDFDGGEWIDRVPELLGLERRPRDHGGAEQVAEFVAETFA